MIELIVTLVVVGLVYYCITLLPIPAPFSTIIQVVFVILAILIVLNFLGVGTGFSLK